MTITPPALVYLGMGLIVARIVLDGKPARGLSGLQWLQLLVDAARITLLWPLVLLVEKVDHFLKSDQDQPLPVILFPPETPEFGPMREVEESIVNER